ncbi:hypothetical protein SAMN02745181_2289 [Rubritalea squalenifaciens DSM 18772]|uniref:Uncharacterized protein n=1 Tax=Rubritalea squalenifaciens DSM 18772 TaxID=1123071 RepID=A0A1M6L4F3_9BACT|nr:hypothetical protein [Rubritalea squalenifaciens]SHJ66066.1 hypothetical protein SAMN02745181_2289 [Rubritalea squalenifaciens DSM 18772]
MFSIDPVSIQFHIPATDHLGKNHVEGKIRFMPDHVDLDWRIKGNVFRGGNQEVQNIKLPYSEIEHVEFRKKWWKFRDIILRISNPALVEEIPGVEMGKMVLEIDERSREEAKKLTTLIDFKRSEFLLDEQNKRLEAMTQGLD